MSFATSLVARLRPKARVAGAVVAATTLAALAITSSMAAEHTTGPEEDPVENGEGVAGVAQLPDLGELPGPPDTLGVQQEAENEGERSPVADAVHEALTGDPGIQATDEEAFGAAVSENARGGGAEFGLNVANAATSAAGADAGVGEGEVGVQEEGGPPEGAAGPPDGVGPEGLEVPPGRP